jgi:FKBP12-rapamycin complex-associated protein
VDYPGLLPLLGRILRAESQHQHQHQAGMGGPAGGVGTGTGEAVKREVVKVMGVLGAMDPYRRKVCLNRADFVFAKLTRRRCID